MRHLVRLGLLACCSAAWADPPAGQIDFSFGDADSDGITEVGFNIGGDWNDWGAALAEDVEGRLVMAGVADLDNGSCLGLMRFSADGVLDTQAFGFNQNNVAKGKICHANPFGAATPLTIDNLVELSLAFQPDGRILVAGWAKSAPFVCRFEPNGRIDASFGVPTTPGCRRFSHISSETYPAPQLLVADSAILLVAQHDIDNGPVITRLSLENGSVLPYGGQTSVRMLGDDAPRALIWAAALTDDGALIAAGSMGTDKADLFNTDFLVARFDIQSGIPDTAFAGQGWRTIAFDKVAKGYDTAQAIELTPDGRVLVAGKVANGVFYQMGLVQLDAETGDPDPSFNAGQPRDYDPCADVPSGCYFSLDSVARSPDGHIVLSGYGGGSDQMFAARLRPDLSPDPTFGDSTGMVFVGQTGFAQGASAGAVLQGNRIVLGGWARADSNDDADFALLRLSGGDLFEDEFEASP